MATRRRLLHLGGLCCISWASFPRAEARHPGCAKNLYPPGLHEGLEVNPEGGGAPSRRFSLYVPEAAAAREALPVLLLTPGNRNDPHQFLKFPDMLSFAEKAPFLLVELMGEHNQFNVELNSAGAPDRPDDVAYTRSVLRTVDRRHCVDRRRVFCAGMSRGARFCVRLASELSDAIAALGIVSGLRYPQPNNATRPMPLIAFHGTADTIDPYQGGGYAYWGTATVAEELGRWAKFNGCKSAEAKQLREGLRLKRFFACDDGADTMLYTIEGAQHSSPGTPYLYGPKTHLLNVTSVMWDFLSQHPLRHDPPRGWSELFLAAHGAAPDTADGRRSAAAVAVTTLSLSSLALSAWGLSRRAGWATPRSAAGKEASEEAGPLL